MSSVLIEESEVEDSILEEWMKRFSTKRPFDIRNYYYHSTTMSGFWEIMYKFDSEKIETGDDKIRTHGTMGLTWMYSVPLKYELGVLQSFFESVYISDKEICLAPALTRPLFAWFTDIDIKQSTELNISYVKTICQIVARTIAKFFPDLINMPYEPPRQIKPLKIKTMAATMIIETQWDDEDGVWIGAGEGVGRLRFIVATSGFKKGLNKDDKMEEGIGIHMYSIGRLFVTEEQAHIMLVAIRNQCEKELGSRNIADGYNTWQDVFDDSVYVGQGGTRVLGSCKVKSCTLCCEKSPVLSIKEEDFTLAKFEKQTAKMVNSERVPFTSKSKYTCPMCNGKKKYLEKKAYEAKFVLNHLGKEDQSMEWLLDDPFQALLATSLRIKVTGPAKGSTWTTHWKTLPGYSPANEKEKQEINKKRRYTAPTDYTKEAKNKQKYNYDALETRSALSHAKEIDQAYLELLPEYLVRDNLKRYKLFIKESRNWKLCLRCDKEHQNRIYFEIDPYYIYQKSHSDNIDCRNGKIIRKKISTDLKELLFGQSQKGETYVPILHNDKEWPVQQELFLVPDGINSGKCFIKETNSARHRKEYMITMFTWLVQKRKDRDPGTERKLHAERESERIKNVIKATGKKGGPPNPIWAPRPDPTEREVYNEMMNPSKKQKTAGNPFHPQKDARGYVWGTIIN